MTTTIILPISRQDFLRAIFNKLEFLFCDREKTNIFCYIDGDQRLYERAKHFIINSKFKNKECVMRNKGLPNVGSARRRRQRIADIHNEIKDIVKPTDFIFLLEDDTLIPANTLKKLMKGYSQYPSAGFISGLEIGRWGFEHIGAWHFDNIYEPGKITSIPLQHDSEDILAADASGFYCMLTRYQLYHDHMFEPFDNILGPDVQYGWTLRKKGYKNYIHNSVRCRHLQKNGEVNFQSANVIQVEFTKINDKWGQKILS